jgi:hypothetical protein
MSFFGISILNLKKTIHFIHFGVRPPNLAAGFITIMQRCATDGVVTWRPLCSGGRG